MSSLAEAWVTPEQYLEFERKAETRSEYYRGRISAMTGASRAHNLITVNISSELRQQLKERPCETYSADMRVRVNATGLYTYPDVVVVCGEARFEDAHGDTLLNPTVLFEALSSSTEAYDRGDKFGHYRQMESLQEYVLVSQVRCLVERYIRQANGQWLLAEFRDMAGTLPLPSIGCELALAEIYSKVVFADEESPRPGVEQG